MSITKFQTVTVESGKSAQVDFGTKVINASVAVQGYNISFDDTDHYVKKLGVTTSMGVISGSFVTVSATCTMENDTSHKGTGNVTVLVVAVCES